MPDARVPVPESVSADIKAQIAEALLHCEQRSKGWTECPLDRVTGAGHYYMLAEAVLSSVPMVPREEYEGSGVHKEIRVLRQRAEDAEAERDAARAEAESFAEQVAGMNVEMLRVEAEADRLREALTEIVRMASTGSRAAEPEARIARAALAGGDET